MRELKEGEVAMEEQQPQAHIVTAPAPAPIQAVTSQPVAPIKDGTEIIFKPSTTDTPKGIEQAMEVANKVTGEAFGQAMLYTLQTDSEMQDQLLSTAKQVIRDKTDSIADMAQTERKAKFFEMNADACQLFGYEEKTTAKFHIKAMAFWAFVLNSLYIFTIGYFVVAPITFILSKIKVVIKKTWLALIFALLVYLLAIGLPILVAWLAKAKALIS